MKVIIPLGGIGKRFKDNNYKNPKALIKVLGKPIIFYLLETLNNKDITEVIIPYNKEYENYNFENLLSFNFPNINFKFIKLNYNTKGAIETIYLAIKDIDSNEPIISLDSDNFFTIDIIEKWNKKNQVFYINDNEKLNIYSRIQLKDNKIINIKEKELISDNIIVGAYGFESLNKLKYYINHCLLNKEMFKNEYYISKVIDIMIKNNIFSGNKINKDEWKCLGTPTQVVSFANNYNFKIERFCFDIDGTLLKFNKDYKKCKPIQKNIDYLNFLYNKGHIIILYTARRMKTYNGNIGLINKNIAKITYDSLEKYNINYHEIHFGKPYANHYIDDLSINASDSLNNELGYYNFSDIKPRYFNELIKTKNTYIKKGNNLEGQIYYYNNIPIELKKYFPKLLNHTENSYEIESINGLNCSTLYVNKLLTKEILHKILMAIKDLHNNIIELDDINIKENYEDKLIKRYNDHNYSFDNINVYNNIIEKLFKYKDYEQSIIHGDPVLSNIFLDNDKIKFIDMRGKIGNKCSIQGDKYYDYAKLYQSLIGYDEIINNIELNIKYKNSLINYFELFFNGTEMKKIKLIAKSLLYSLIPLHKDNTLKFYNLLLTIK